MSDLQLRTPKHSIHDLGRSQYAPLVSKGRPDALNFKTYYTIFARWHGKVRLFTIESEMIETEAEALAAVRENEWAVLVYRNDPDAPRQDVSEEIARAWLKQLVAEVVRGPQDLPTFISEHLGDSADASDLY